MFDKFYVNFIIPFDILSTLGFLSLGTVDIWGWIILCCGKMMCIVEYLVAWKNPHNKQLQKRETLQKNVDDMNLCCSLNFSFM